jgi:hypothetical protein
MNVVAVINLDLDGVLEYSGSGWQGMIFVIMKAFVKNVVIN